MASKAGIRSIVVSLIPPIFYPLLRTVVNSSVGNTFYSPKWHVLSKGTFKDISLYFDADNQGWGNSILNGAYDAYFFSVLSKMNIKGKTVFDVGAHIGLSSLSFAKLVGQKGKVVAFEPNPANRKRLELNISKNESLQNRIVVESDAVSNKIGPQYFLFTNNIDDGTSSGSVIGSIKNTKQKMQYENEFKFQKTRVKSQTLDSFIRKLKMDPDIVKIDVEGAESVVLQGARNLLKKRKTLFLVELHSILNGHEVTKILAEYGYTFSTISVEDDGRTFIAALPSRRV